MKFKALVFIRLRSQVDDSPGNAVRDCCGRMSELDIKKLRLGKVVDIWLEAETREYAEKELIPSQHTLWSLLPTKYQPLYLV